MLTTLIIIGVILFIAFSLYNTVINKKNQVEYAFGGMDAMLKKRYDLIPNLVSTVQQYMTHEKETLTKLTELRAKATTGNVSDDDKVDLNNQISGALGKIVVAVENYPDLKANQNFLQLQASLNEVEEQISAARRAYNGAVTDYNNCIEMVPTNIFAGMMNLQRKKVFEIPETQRDNVNVGNIFKK